MTSVKSRKYQPFATIPCWAGIKPVSNVACTVQVTAGSTVVIGLANPVSSNRRMFGVFSLIISCVKPTTLMTTSCRISLLELISEEDLSEMQTRRVQSVLLECRL